MTLFFFYVVPAFCRFRLVNPRRLNPVAICDDAKSNLNVCDFRHTSLEVVLSLALSGYPRLTLTPRLRLCIGMNSEPVSFPTTTTESSGEVKMKGRRA